VDYTSTSSSDSYLEGKYLGRYGIVRNNWYELELGTISGPGDPEKPSSTTDPDDSKKTYISATVKIMDWAVRKQSVNL
ncbi:Mfa1 fimbrilin C-terminal domain-containing protein, partial [bacterium]|nr:Mfa1 fimbrilin C-terminal domain-containing protein [bacterium]